MILSDETFRGKATHRVIGLMSGTSADGIDAALCAIAGHGRGALKVELIASHSLELPENLRHRVLSACQNDGGSSLELCELNFVLGEAFAAAALGVIADAKLQPGDVDLIGSHGQTVHHMPPRSGGGNFQMGSTLQIGEAAVIAERTGIAVVSSFRTRDMAAGGQGAPLVPFVDDLLFADAHESRAALNIGGISNLTWMPAGAPPEKTIAFDSGPGNMIIDAMVEYMSQGEQTYDRDGAIAATGKVHPQLLDAMMRHPYLDRTPPKSTGREEFGADYAVDMYEWCTKNGLVILPRDIIATATRFTALSIAESLRQFVFTRGAVQRVIVSGGGALNPVLMEHLKEELGSVAIVTSDSYGLPVKLKESMAFAVLARETALGRCGNLPSATGAAGPRVLGQFTPA
jgi:anhydro-N-acetylmuramic acid kinase